MTAILIADPIPLLNKGEEALLEGIVESLSICFDNPDITLLSNYPEEDKSRSRVPVLDRNGVSLRVLKKLAPKFAFLLEGITVTIQNKIKRNGKRCLIDGSNLWKAFINSDIIIVGHDSSVSYDAIIVGRLLNKPLAIFAGSVEIFNNSFKQIVARTLLKKVDLITLRETYSYNALFDLGVVPIVKAEVTADAAFLLRPCSSKRAKEIMLQEGLPAHSRPMVGVTLTRQMCERSRPEITDIEKRYEKAVLNKAAVFDRIIDSYGVEIVFFPHCIGPGKSDDRPVALDVISEMTRKDMAKLVDGDFSAAELKGLIKQCEIFIGERTHSVIAALSQGIPSLCMTFPSDRRTHGIIGEMLNHKDFVYNIERLDPEELLGLIDLLWAGRQAIREKLSKTIPSIREKALRSAGLIRALVDEKVDN